MRLLHLFIIYVIVIGVNILYLCYVLRFCDFEQIAKAVIATLTVSVIYFIIYQDFIAEEQQQGRVESNSDSEKIRYRIKYVEEELIKELRKRLKK